MCLGAMHEQIVQNPGVQSKVKCVVWRTVETGLGFICGIDANDGLT